MDCVQTASVLQLCRFAVEPPDHLQSPISAELQLAIGCFLDQGHLLTGIVSCKVHLHKVQALTNIKFQVCLFE